MRKQRVVESLFTVLGGGSLLIASQGRYAYSFYVALRLFVTILAVFWAYRTYCAGPRIFTWVFGGMALLLNPLVPIRMRRADWQPIDLWLGIGLLSWSAYSLLRNDKTEAQN